MLEDELEILVDLCKALVGLHAILIPLDFKLCLATWKVYGNLVKENQEIRPHMQKRLKIYRPNVNKNRIKRLLILECQPRQPMVTRIVTGEGQRLIFLLRHLQLLLRHLQMHLNAFPYLIIKQL